MTVAQATIPSLDIKDSQLVEAKNSTSTSSTDETRPVINKLTDTGETREAVESLSKEAVKSIPVIATNQSPAMDKLHEFFYHGPTWFQWFRDKFCLTLNSFGIAFNAIAVIATNSSFFSKETAKFLDEKSEWFAKYIIPFSFGWNGIEALMGKRLPEAFSRLIPAGLFSILPFYNLNLATGISSALNYLFEHVKDRHGGKPPGDGDVWKNATETMKTSVDVFKDMLRGDQSKEDLPKQLATIFLLAGSLGGFAFARESRDSTLARIFGNMRNIGGVIADWKLIFNGDPDPKRSSDLKIVGSTCSLASVLNILMRWVDPKLARALNHISIAMDDFGLTYWAQGSKRDNDLLQKDKQLAKPASEAIDLHKAEQNTAAKTLAV